MSKNKIQATVNHNEESCIRDIQKFNELAGHGFYKRDVEDPDVEMQEMIIDEEYEEFKEAMQSGEIKDIAKEVCDMIVVATGMLHKLGIDPVAAMKEVNASNLSKFADTEKEAEESVEKWSKGSRYENVYWEKVGNKYVIQGKVAGSGNGGFKVLKSVGYVPANMSGIVE